MKVICKLPNAASLINGIKFEAHKLGVISEEIADEVGEHFLKIPGYVRVGAPAKAAPAAPGAAGAADGGVSSGDTGAAGPADDAGAASGGTSEGSK